MPESKKKLRTASDVISRLRWEEKGDESHAWSIMIGYMDRIEGVMEKAVKDYVSASSGGDIPEHRILYFRPAGKNSNEILWDRAGRVDRIFASGAGPDAPVAPETATAVEEAIRNMKRIEQEKEERRIKKARERARRYAQQKISEPRTVQLSPQSQKQPGANRQERFCWVKTTWYVYSSESNQWGLGCYEDEVKTRRYEEWHLKGDEKSFIVVTWNVLFELFDKGLEAEGQFAVAQTRNIPGLDSIPGDVCFSESRWKKLCSFLQSSNADLISLQEATPGFLKVLCQSDWIRKDYAISASPSAMESVIPSGVLLLWRRSTMGPTSRDSALYTCSDNGRNRSVMAQLCHHNCRSNLFFAAAHLPADRAIQSDVSNGHPREKNSRMLARKRELSAILGQFERLVQQNAPAFSVTPIIAGDFNCEDDEILDGLFASTDSSLFSDAWFCAGEGPGFTFDPVRNPRAARSSNLVSGDGKRKRIDRIFLGPTYSGQSCLDRQIEFVAAELIGAKDDGMPPSDHYGVVGKIECSKINSPEAKLRPMNIWAANAPTSRHYLLALILENPALERLKSLHDPDSALPRLHITLLHGFVEADFGCLDLAKNAVRDTLIAANSLLSPPSQFSFCQDGSLSIFEHRGSCTLLAIPDMESPSGHWLRSFYFGLRERFVTCNDQEKHSGTGWTPHVTLGVAGSSGSAREMQMSWIESESWSPGLEHMAVQSVDILRRGENGKFYSIASLSCQPAPQVSYKADHIVADGASKLSRNMDEKSSLVLSRVRRACRLVGQDMHLSTSVHLTGSSQLHVAMPGLSDIDAVVKVEPDASHSSEAGLLESQASMDSFFENVLTKLSEEIQGVKARFRPAAGNRIMTLRFPGLPTADLSFCACDRNGCAINDSSQNGLDTIKDGEVLLNALKQSGGEYLVEAYQQALRIIKIWSYRRDIYGAASGFLGGGGWAVWLAKIAMDAVESGKLAVKQEGCAVPLFHNLVHVFFDWAASIPLESISIRHTNVKSLDATRQQRAGMFSILAAVSNGDFGRTTTQSTTNTTLHEIQCAARTLKQNSTVLADLLKATSSANFIAEFQHILYLEISTPSTASIKLADLKAWGNQQFLNMLVVLDTKIGDPAYLRPKSRPLRRDQDWNSEHSDDNRIGFTWLVGLKLDMPSHKELFLSLQSWSLVYQSRLNSEAQRDFDQGKVPLLCHVRMLATDRAKARILECAH